MDKIKTVKIKNPDGSISEETYIISVDATNVDMENGKDLQDTIGDIDIDHNGNIAMQLNILNNNIDNLNEKIDKKIYYFNTISDMKMANLEIGDYACTLGYYEPNDGGHGTYLIIHDDNSVDDGGSIHNVRNGNKAQLIINNTINIKQFGAKTGTTDTSLEIQKCIDFVTNSYSKGKGYLIIIPAGKYTIANSILLNYYTRIKSEGCVQFVLRSDISNMIMFDIQEQPKLTLDTVRGYWDAGWFNSPILNGANGGIQLFGNSNKGTGNIIGIRFGEISNNAVSPRMQLHNVMLQNIGIENFTIGLQIIPNNIYCNTFDELDFHNCGIGVQYSELNRTGNNSGERITFLNSTWGNVAEGVRIYTSTPLQFHNCSFDMGGCVTVNYADSSRFEMYNCWIERNGLVNSRYSYSSYFPNLNRGIFINNSTSNNSFVIYLNDCFFTYGDECSQLDDNFLIRGKIDLYLHNMHMSSAYNWGLGQGDRNTKGQLFLCSPEVIIHNKYDYKGCPKLSTRTTQNKNAQFEELEVGEITFTGINTEIGEFVVYECFNPERIAKVEITDEDALTPNGKSLKVTAGSTLSCAFRMINKNYKEIPENVNYMWADIYAKRDISTSGKQTYVNARVDFFDENYTLISEATKINTYDYNAQSTFLLPSTNQWFRTGQSAGYQIPDNAKYYKVRYNVNLLPSSNGAVLEIGDYGYVSGLFVDFAK